MKNSDLGLENAALGLRPRAAFSRPRSQFFTIRTSQPANNIYLFLKNIYISSQKQTKKVFKSNRDVPSAFNNVSTATDYNFKARELKVIQGNTEGLSIALRIPKDMGESLQKPYSEMQIMTARTKTIRTL